MTQQTEQQTEAAKLDTRGGCRCNPCTCKNCSCWLEAPPPRHEAAAPCLTARGRLLPKRQNDPPERHDLRQDRPPVVARQSACGAMARLID